MSFKIALDAGHGLKTAGKQTPDGIKEWTLNDKVRDKVVKLLKDYDVEFVFPDKNEGTKDEGLTTRRTMYVKEKVNAAVSIHHNANTGTWNSATGVEVYTDKNATAKDKKLAECIYERLVKNTGLKGRGIKRANWTVIDQDTIPAVLVEGGFMDGKNDYKVITSDAGQDAYAKAVADGLIEFLGLKKKVVEAPKPIKKTIAQIAQEVLDGKWGNGDARKKALKSAGYDYDAVQDKVNELLKKNKTQTAKPAKKTVNEIAKEVLKGKWGNGDARKKALKAAGYDPVAVQKRVNEML